MTPEKKLADFFFAKLTLAIMVIKDADYYLTQYDLKAIILVDQDYTTRSGQETRAEVWNLFKRIVYTQNEPLVEVHKKVKGLDFSFSKTKMKTQLKDWIDDPTSFWASNRENFPLLSNVWRRVAWFFFSAGFFSRLT